MGLHWATNGLGYAFSWLLIRTRNRRRERHRQSVREKLDRQNREPQHPDDT
jgi:hypothetical protein